MPRPRLKIAVVTDIHHGAISKTKIGPAALGRLNKFVDFANDAPFLLVGLSNGRLEGYDCVDIQRPQLLFSRKLSIEPLVSIRARPLGQRLGPKKKIEEDDGVLLEEDVTIFTEGGEVMRVDSVEIKSHLYRLRMIRKQYPHDFQPEKDDLNTLTGMVKFDGFKRIAPIRDGVCIGNVPLKCSEIGLREKRNGGLNMLFNNSDDSESDDRDKDEHDEEKFGFVACGKSALAFVQALSGFGTSPRYMECMWLCGSPPRSCPAYSMIKLGPCSR